MPSWSGGVAGAQTDQHVFTRDLPATTAHKLFAVPKFGPRARRAAFEPDITALARRRFGLEHPRRWGLEVPNDADPAQRLQDIPGQVELPPEEPLAGRRLIAVVIVVPALAERRAAR